MSATRSDPLVSVIIPTFNRRGFVLDAVESVLQQGVEGTEVVVVDDGSSDDTRELFRSPSPGVRYVYQENGGVSSARNRGVAESRGRLISFLDSDDVWTPGKLRAQLGLVTSNTVVSFQGVAWFAERAEDEPMLSQPQTLKWPRTGADGFVRAPMQDVAEGRYFHLGTLLCTRETFMDVGWFDPGLCLGEDEDWFSRASLKKRFHYTPEPFLRRRFHADQTNLDSERSINSLITVFSRMAARAANLDPKAQRAASRRLAAKLSQLSNCLMVQNRRKEAVEAMSRACMLTPFNLARLAKMTMIMARPF